MPYAWFLQLILYVPAALAALSENVATVVTATIAAVKILNSFI